MGNFRTGREALFTYATGPETIVTTKFNAVRFRITRKYWPTTPPGYLMQRFTPGILMISGVLGNWLDGDDATPPVPGGTGVPSSTYGTFTISTASGESYAFKGSLIELDADITLDEGGAPTTYRYAFIGNAQNTTDTITVT